MLDTAALKKGLNTSVYNTGTDDNERRIYQKIGELNKQINQPAEPQASSDNSNQAMPSGGHAGNFTNDVDRLQGMMQQVSDKPETDPEMQQLNGTLDKILDIQNPDRVKDKINAASLKNKQQVFTVSKEAMPVNISLLDTGKNHRVHIMAFIASKQQKLMKHKIRLKQ